MDEMQGGDECISFAEKTSSYRWKTTQPGIRQKM